jgi:MFS transporter, DHA1 family, tetracycline resistance protein
MLENFFSTVALMSFIALAAPVARLLSLSTWQVGSAVTAAALAWIIMARIWGNLSDRLGRRRIVLIGIVGFAVSNLLLVAFVDVALRFSLTPVGTSIGLAAIRTLMGTFYAAVPTTIVALIADLSADGGRTKALASINAAGSVGMVIGPALAGALGAVSVTTALFATAILPLVVFPVLWRTLPRDDTRVRHSSSVAIAFSDRRLRAPVAMILVASFAVGIAELLIGFLALDRLHLDAAGAAHVSGLTLTVVGVTLVLSQLAMRHLPWPPALLLRAGGMIASLGFAAVMFGHSVVLYCLAYAVAAVGLGWVYPASSALCADSVGSQEQGSAAGVISSAGGVGTLLGPIIGSYLYGIDPGWPFGLSTVLLVICSVGARKLR